MEKEAVIHYCDKLKSLFPLQFEDIDINNIELYLDVTSESELIKEIIGTNQAKFYLILYTILSGDYNDELYKKEGEGIYAMRFSSPNSRIYCKEVHGIGVKKKIIMSRAIRNKTSQKNGKQITTIIESIQKSTFKYFNKYEETEKYKRQHSKKE